MTNRELVAYTAGIIDGEGCIQIGKAKAKPPRKTDIYTLSVRVGSSNKDIIDFLHLYFGGQVAVRSNPPHKPIFTWALVSSKAHLFLRIVYDYLIIKKKEAEIAFSFQKTIEGHGVWRRVKPELIAEREKHYRIMRTLKQ